MIKRPTRNKTLGLRIWRMAFGTVLAIFAPLAVLFVYNRFAWRSPGAGSGAMSIASAALFVSVLTALASLGGFVSTTLLMWKRERADEVRRELDKERTQLEIERLRRELDRDKESDTSPPTSPSTPDG